MKKTIFGLFLCAVFLSGCGRMNVDFPPPSDFASVTELFPAAVDGVPMQLTRSGLSQGLAYAYQGVGSVWVYRTNDEASAAAFFDSEVALLFDGFSSVKRWNINGRRQVQAKGGDGYAVGWTNGKWLFLIRAAEKKGFKKLIDVYPWIED